VLQKRKLIIKLEYPFDELEKLAFAIGPNPDRGFISKSRGWELNPYRAALQAAA
jgi:hypothetical protein